MTTCVWNAQSWNAEVYNFLWADFKPKLYTGCCNSLAIVLYYDNSKLDFILCLKKKRKKTKTKITGNNLENQFVTYSKFQQHEKEKVVTRTEKHITYKVKLL